MHDGFDLQFDQSFNNMFILIHDLILFGNHLEHHIHLLQHESIIIGVGIVLQSVISLSKMDQRANNFIYYFMCLKTVVFCLKTAVKV
ncbi:hypothetical protein ACJX0J_030284 [Zea mays]